VNNKYGMSCGLHGIFMMEGLRDRCQKFEPGDAADGYSALLKRFEYGGALELMLNMAEYTEYVEHKLNNVPEDAEWAGVYQYEVVASFGMWFADYVYEHGHTPPTVEAMKEIDRLHEMFFQQ
jgi:hypothetical protein